MSDMERLTDEQVKHTSEPIRALIDRVSSVIVGQRGMVESLLIGLLTGGHVLMEGVPGLAKTLTVSTLAAAIDASFKRIQFTPDLLPADLIGTLVYHPREGTFTPRKGPVFASIVLADEINRAPAKVQSALLEAMQERHVTIGDTTYPLPDPFLVLATQNPIEQEGTYPLPEAQVDRFMLKVRVGYPSKTEEREILDRMVVPMAVRKHAGGAADPSSANERMESRPVSPVITVADVRAARESASRVYLDDKIREYIVSLVFATRAPAEYRVNVAELVQFGASPRATICLAQASKARALLERRTYVTPQDVKSVAMEVLRHRVIVTYEAEARDLTSEDVVREILNHVRTP